MKLKIGNEVRKSNKKLPKIIALIIAFALILSVSFISSGQEALASAANPTVITTEAQLRAITNTGNYILGNDITLTQVWAPRGGTSGFSGTFDGNRHTIRDLRMDISTDSQGFFTRLNGATVRNLNIELGGNLRGGAFFGTLAGRVGAGTTIENVHINGNGHNVEGRRSYVGGFVGWTERSANAAPINIRNSSVSNMNVSSTGFEYVGGFVGNSRQTNFEDVRVSDVTVRSNLAFAGGFAGVIENASVVDNATVERVNVRTSLNYAGGFVGSLRGINSTTGPSTVRNARVNGGDVSGNSYVGGFAGAIHQRSNVSNIRISNVNTVGRTTLSSYAGGFAGTIYGRSSVADVRVSGGSVIGNGRYAGGFAGEIMGNSWIYNSFADTPVRGRDTAGGFAGIVYGGSSVSWSGARGDVTTTATGLGYAGGFIGQLHNASVDISYARGNVNSGGYIAGGFIGEMAHNARISNTYAWGNVQHGRNVGTLLDGAGGLVGFLSGVGTNIIEHSYAAGNITTAGNRLGGLTGHTNGTFRGHSFWDTLTTGTPIGTGQPNTVRGTRPTGHDTETMFKQETFESVGWDFQHIWIMNDYDPFYPVFRSEPGEPPIVEPSATVETYTVWMGSRGGGGEGGGTVRAGEMLDISIIITTPSDNEADVTDVAVIMAEMWFLNFGAIENGTMLLREHQGGAVSTLSQAAGHFRIGEEGQLIIDASHIRTLAPGLSKTILFSLRAAADAEFSDLNARVDYIVVSDNNDEEEEIED